MKRYIEERAIELAMYIIEKKATVRLAAKKFGISKSTVHKDVTERLEKIKPLAKDELLEPVCKKAEPRIPFGSVIEHGLLNPGTRLFDSKRRYCATVKADGTLMTDTVKGSIHQVGAKVQGLPSCNGWTFWHFEDNRKKELESIDSLRQQLKSEMFAV